MANELAIIQKAKRQGLGDTVRHKCRFDIHSQTSSRIYRVSFDIADGACYWVCSCPGCIRHGQCKHLTAMGLKGRRYGRDLAWKKRILELGR